MILARNLRLAFGNQTVFDNISFTLQGHERIGLFGLNGSGKSTMLKVIAGQHKLDGGKVTIANDATVAYLPQEVTLQSDKSIIEEVLSTFGEMISLQEQLVELEAKLALNSQDVEVIEAYANACEQLALLNPEQKKASAERMLVGLGFDQHKLNAPVKELSVGWKMRIVLAKLLLQNADFYLFDEPTNHLDIVTKEWFLKFLQQASFGFLLVCHEKRFLNVLCTEIMELERGRATIYSGGYDDYVAQKEENLVRLTAAYTNQQREIKQMKETINRFRASASKAAMAQSMIKKLEKIEIIEIPPTAKSMNFSFPPLERSGRTVLTVKGVSQAFGEKQVFKNASFEIERGQRVAIVAANGVGKTTLLNVVSGRLPLQSGTIEFGHGVTSAIFDQDQTASLAMQRTVFENACNEAPPKTTEPQIRALLGAFLFSGQLVNKKAQVLSGGERNRLGMIRVLLQNANLLLLDEPTNHLDIPSKDLLLKALQTYEGTILFVSHDQDFVNQLATHIIELTPQGTAFYHGNYDEFIYQKEVSTPKASESKVKQKKVDVVITDPEEKKKAARIVEKKIAACEKEIAKVEQSFEHLEYGEPAFDRALKALQTLQQEHVDLMAEWAVLNG